MKLVRNLFIALTVLAFVPTASFALVDIGGYGSYSFAGDIEDVSANPKGFEYGFNAHFNFDLLPKLLQMGIGGYFQKSPLKYETGGNEYEFDKTAVGLDLFLQLSIPMIPIMPYGKFSMGIWEEAETSLNGTVLDTSDGYFKCYSFGAGLAVTVLPIPGIMKLQLFGEYLYTFSKLDGTKVKGNAVHLGIRVWI